MRFLLVSFLGLSIMLAFEVKINNKIKEIDYEYLDNSYITSQNLSFKDNSNLMIKFKEVTPEIVKEFENKYNLDLVSVLVSGYYIYKIDNKLFDKISTILQDNANIDTIVPVWEMRVRKR